MKNIITILLLFVVASSMKAQNLPAVDIVNESGYISNENTSDDNIEGSIYLSEEWVSTAKIYTSLNNSYSPKLLNYNVKLETFVVKIAEDSLFTLDKSKVKLIEFDSKSFKIYNDKYYEVLSEGNFNLYKTYYLEIIPGAKDPMTKVKISEDKYVIKSTYYIKNDTLLEEVRLNKKNILKSLQKEKVSKVKQYIKENNLSVKKDNDLKKILDYYNTL